VKEYDDEKAGQKSFGMKVTVRSNVPNAESQYRLMTNRKRTTKS
jgi:hypothetical protein